MTLIELLIAISISSLVITATCATMISMIQSFKHQEMLVALSELRLNFEQLILSRDPQGLGHDNWTATVNDPTNQATANTGCLVNNGPWYGTSCLAAKNSINPFRLMSYQTNTVIYDGLTAKSGFTAGGTYCTTFSQSNNDEICVLHLVLTWTPTCAAADINCVSPYVVIDGKFQYAGRDQTPLNLANYNFHFVRPGASMVQNSPCWQSYDLVANPCNNAKNNFVICTATGWQCLNFAP